LRPSSGRIVTAATSASSRRRDRAAPVDAPELALAGARVDLSASVSGQGATFPHQGKRFVPPLVEPVLEPGQVEPHVMALGAVEGVALPPRPVERVADGIDQSIEKQSIHGLQFIRERG
jgi:hypothetical protein